MENRTELSIGNEIFMTSRNKNHPWNKPIVRGYGLIEVRDPYCTVYSSPRKYYDPDTGKFNTDKMVTLNSLSLSDMTLDEHEDNWVNPYVNQAKRDREEIKQTSIIYKFPKFVPKDNDFDEEERLEKQRLLAKKQEIEKKIAENRQKLVEKEDEYKKFLKQREEALAQQRAANIQTTGPMSGRLVLRITNIRPNNWRPK